MKTAKYYLKIYFKLAAQYLKGRMQYRADFFCEIIGMFFVNIFEFMSIWVVFNTITQLGGWSLYEMLFLYSFALLARSPQQLLLDNGWTLSHKVVNGDFIKYCFRPINILFYFMSETVDIKGFCQMILGIIMLIYSWVKLGIPVTVLNIIMFIVFYLGAVFVCMGLIILSCTCGFLGGGTNAAMMLASNLKDYARYPLTIFNNVIKFIFTFIIPVGFVAYYPAIFFVNNISDIPVIVYFSPIVGFVFFMISSCIWIHFANRYAGTGS